MPSRNPRTKPFTNACQRFAFGACMLTALPGAAGTVNCGGVGGNVILGSAMSCGTVTRVAGVLPGGGLYPGTTGGGVILGGTTGDVDGVGTVMVGGL